MLKADAQCAIDISWMSNGLPKWDVSNWTSNGCLMDFQNGMSRIGHPWMSHGYSRVDIPKRYPTADIY